MGLSYAVADIHGRYDLFDKMLAKIFAFHAKHGAAYGKLGRLVTLGDYVDRGPDSRAVLQRILTLPQEAARHGLQAVSLMGNHEEMMLLAIQHGDNSVHAHNWALNGGIQALRSYGELTGAAVDREHVDLLRSLKKIAIFDNLVFAHAGINGHRELWEQTSDDLLWTRNPFHGEHRCHRLVVHGHTPHRGMPAIVDNALNLDTGACFGGPLSCGVITDDASLVTVLQVEDMAAAAPEEKVA